ncbi:MAG: uroporphyrinogen decarboxylase family protein [Desulfobacteraceae bacterium]|jgi:uroporphyrinogen-III decarboxylase
MTGENTKKDYLARKKRMEDAMAMRKPDRVPVAPIAMTFYPTNIKGISNREAMFNMDHTYRIWREIIVAHDWDIAPPPTPLMSGRFLEIIDSTQIKWPGGALQENQPWQWVEGEFVKPDEYDEMLANPNLFSIFKFWPRISGTMAPLAELAQMKLPPLTFVTNAMALPPFLGGLLSQPQFKGILEKLLALVNEFEAHGAIIHEYMNRVTSLGYPLPWGGIVSPAFDCVSDFVRGMQGSMLDMFRDPEKLLSLVEMFTPHTIESAIAMADQAGSKGVYIPMHRGAAGFMSDEQFARFYWPCVKELFLGLVDAGYTPMPLFEGDYTPRLKYLAQLPPGKIVGHFDKIDRQKAKRTIGEVMCFWGNVPPSLLCTGTPQDVVDDVRALIDLFGDNGGLIIDCSNGLPDEARPENVRAMKEAVLEYGQY